MTSLPEHKTISRLCYVWDMLCCFWHSNESWLNIRAEPIGDLSSSFVASAARQEDFGHGHFGYGSGQSRDRDMIWQNSAFHNTFLMAVWWATPMEFWAFFPWRHVSDQGMLSQQESSSWSDTRTNPGATLPLDNNKGRKHCKRPPSMLVEHLQCSWPEYDTSCNLIRPVSNTPTGGAKTWELKDCHFHSPLSYTVESGSCAPFPFQPHHSYDAFELSSWNLVSGNLGQKSNIKQNISSFGRVVFK